MTDLGLRLPLNGVQWIEASAGTGKTFIVATLYARLVIEAGLPVPSLLAVTFTEAATAELRDRLRARLALAQAIAEGRAQADSPELRATSPLVAAAIEREGLAPLQRRLRLAVEAMDLAPIHTIHGFCRRALADHALEAGQPLIERAIVENERLLREEVATDFWRDCSVDVARTRILLSLWHSPAALANDLRDLLAIDELRPRALAFEPAGPLDNALGEARRALADAFRQHGDEARARLREAFATGQVSKTYVKDTAVDPVWQALADWVATGSDDGPATDKLENYSRSQLQLRTNKNKIAPVSPLFEAIEAWVVATQSIEERDQQRRIALVQEVRRYGRDRLDALKRERGLIGYDDMVRGVDEALSGAGGERFAEQLRGQYRVALVDEFQDTDPRQWSIFRRLFVESDDLERALFLIGDPKQAIYRFRGGDVYTYLAARASADQQHALASNFRSRPSALAAIEALFGDVDAFAQPGIEFHPVSAGGQVSDNDLQLDGVALPALNFERLSGLADANIEAARAAATTACVARIHALLAAGLAGRALRRGRDGAIRSLAPGDIAVLVARNADADRIRIALAAAGIPCVAAGRNSLYASDEADELRVLLHALLEPADDRRLRAALAMPLLGADAADLLALDGDEAAHRHWQDRFQDWRERCERFGPLALVSTLCAENAPRLLALIDGERRLTNLLQLAEELQAARADRLGLAGLLDELERRILAADNNNDGELLRLESDSARVKILTLHKSKGLEFDLVFLPYAATGGTSGKGGDSRLKLARYHDGEQGIAELFAEKDSQAAKHDAKEQRAEDLRLLYVGLTRARLATWVGWGAVKDAVKTPLAWLMHRGADGPLDDAVVAATLARIASPAIAVTPALTALPTQRLIFAPPEPTPPAAIANRQFDRDWWVYSFSQLAREDDGADPTGARDEIEPIPDALASRFAGARFGNALHAALEATDFAAWHDWTLELPPTGEYEHVAGALRGQGYASEADQLEGLPLLTHLVAATLNARMPEGAVLARLPSATRCPELEFHLAFDPVAVPALIESLHAHGIVRDRHGFGLRRRIEGLLTGFIDLVYEHAGRYYVLDYKSNRLPDYAPATLAQSVRENEYDLQYTLYSLALHRWLRFRLGAAYDYDTHMGGVRYLYCRGLIEGEGIHALTLPRALIESLDMLMAPAVVGARSAGDSGPEGPPTRSGAP
jgi:exodeoxyribonuclease V beta subunit